MIKVFIVEDEPNILFLYQDMVSVIGFEVVGTAKDGEMALKQYKEFNSKPDLIIMDHRMPKKEGIETTKEILSLHPEAKVLFASADNTVRDEAFAVGAVGFLSKPFTLQRLKEKILEIIND